eukprot:c13492_g1_i1 orf=193-1617(+)
MILQVQQCIMQQKASNCMIKDPGSAIPLFHRCFFLKLPHETEEITIPLQLEINVESLHEKGVRTDFEEKATNQGDTTSMSYSTFESKEALLPRSLGDDGERDSESAEQFHQKSCLPSWRKLGSSHAHKSSNHDAEALFIDINAQPMKGGSTIQGNNRIMPEREIHSEEGVPCGRITCPPLSAPWRCFTIKEITDATKNFHPGNLVGKGGYAKVYRGSLSTGQIIAIKKLNQSDLAEHREKEFLVEIGIMAHVCHPNTTPLVGFCLEGGLYLIYNFYPNGSLAGMLHGTRLKTFDWPSRYKVAVGIARGLLYLHEQCRRRIIHRDIKASNILLDGDFEPQISDFGLAKWLPKEWSHHSVSPVEGTFGYLAPEYHMHGIVDEKIDVYSFGVLLLEIISGRRPVEDDQQCLVLWARPLLEARNIQDLADPELRGCYDHQQMGCMIITAEMCIRQSSISRPPMSQVLKLLGVKESSWS